MKWAMIAGSVGEIGLMIGLTMAPLKQPMVGPKYHPIARPLPSSADANRRVELPTELPDLADL